MGVMSIFSKRELEPIKSKLLHCRPHLRLGIIVPHTQWLEKKRKYLQIISNSLNSLDKVWFQNSSRFLFPHCVEDLSALQTIFHLYIPKKD